MEKELRGFQGAEHTVGQPWSLGTRFDFCWLRREASGRFWQEGSMLVLTFTLCNVQSVVPGLTSSAQHLLLVNYLCVANASLRVHSSRTRDLCPAHFTRQPHRVVHHGGWGGLGTLGYPGATEQLLAQICGSLGLSACWDSHRSHQCYSGQRAWVPRSAGSFFLRRNCIALPIQTRSVHGGCAACAVGKGCFFLQNLPSEVAGYPGPSWSHYPETVLCAAP